MEKMDIEEIDMEEEEEEEYKEEDTITKEQLEILEQKIKANNYNSKKQFLKFLNGIKEINDIERYKSEREKYFQIFALNEKEWIEIIEEEEMMATTEEEYKEIELIYEKALKEFEFINIWIKYLKFKMEIKKDSVENIRKIFEEALYISGKNNFFNF
jgi:hypothetical protein